MPPECKRELSLSPAQDLVALENTTAVLACSPFCLPYSHTLILAVVEQDFVLKVEDPRLTSTDFEVNDTPSMSNRTYTLGNVSRSDDSKRFVCVVGDEVSNEVMLKVYGER